MSWASLANTPEIKQQFKQWTTKGEPTRKKAKKIPSAGKIVATVLWDARKVIFIDYLKKAKQLVADRCV